MEKFSYRDVAAKALKFEKNKNVRRYKGEAIKSTPEYLAAAVKHSVNRGRLLGNASEKESSGNKVEEVSRSEYFVSKYDAEILKFAFIPLGPDLWYNNGLKEWVREGEEAGELDKVGTGGYVEKIIRRLPEIEEGSQATENKGKVENLKLAKIKLKNFDDKYCSYINQEKGGSESIPEDIKKIMYRGRVKGNGARLFTALKPLMDKEGLSFCPAELAPLLAMHYEEIMKKEQSNNERLLVAMEPIFDGDLDETLEVCTDYKGVRRLIEPTHSSYYMRDSDGHKLTKDDVETYLLFAFEE